jgi:hypothetical protein
MLRGREREGRLAVVIIMCGRWQTLQALHLFEIWHGRERGKGKQEEWQDDEELVDICQLLGLGARQKCSCYSTPLYNIHR